MAGRVLTVQEISRTCQVSIQTVLSWVSDGRLRTFRTPGGHRRVLSLELRAFLERNLIPEPAALQGFRKKILGVDDDPVILNGVARIIKKLDRRLTVETATDGKEAHEKFNRFAPDLVILDLLLPQVDGFAVCEKIRSSSTRDVKILALTGEDTNENRKRILACGADDYLGKPFEVPVLTGKISALLDI